jgi:hypothetical protein
MTAFDFDTLQREMELQITQATDSITEAFAEKMLVQMRAILAPYNLKRHDIRIVAGMGIANLAIYRRGTDERVRFVNDFSDWHHGRVIDELCAVDALLDDWRWTYHLDGRSLTP